MNVFLGRSICYSVTLVRARGLLHFAHCVCLMMCLQRMHCDVFGGKLNSFLCQE